jgi:hypothetical protein
MLIATTLKQLDQTRAEESVADLDDAELVRRALTDDARAWGELVRRFRPLIRKQLGRAMARWRRFLCSDSVDEALSEYWIALLKNDRAWLRRFNPASGHPLAKWLGVLAWDVGNKHVRAMRRHRAGRPMHGLDMEREPWNDRGARFFAALDRIQPAKKTSNRFKWR